MTSSDAGATSSSISSPTEPSPMPMLSPTPSLTPSPVSTTSDNSNHRPFAGGLLRSGSERRPGIATNYADHRAPGIGASAPDVAARGWSGPRDGPHGFVRHSHIRTRILRDQ